MRADLLKSVLDNYVVLQELWNEAYVAVSESEMRARISGVAFQMDFLVCTLKKLF